ncbi:MAG: sigma-54 dependent transcriptional regulator [Maricaulaceae bacterium]|jgi:DNA-binding NtrC family response regulator
MAKTVLIVDDDPTQRRLLQAVIEREGFHAVMADSGEAALEQLQQPGGSRLDVCLLDLMMPGGLDGLETLEQMSRIAPALPVIVLTAQGGIETVVKAMRAGARDFFVKPASPERIVVSIRNVMKMGELEGEVKRLKKTADGALTFADMIAAAPAMRHVVRLGERAATSNIPILILGESGVGKELVARSIQGGSDRAGKPFVTVNCGAIPENLVESILFGHEKGSFTGANAKHLGKFQEANGGTLFLDEVGELPLDMQVKLLRALQEREIDPIGSKRPVTVDVRIISATNRDLAERVKEGAFREDLFYRLNVFPIEVPPLRRRKEDVALLVDHFIARFNAQEGRRVQGPSPETLAMLKAFDWPGNVRQLENAVFRAVVLCEGETLQPSDFPQISGQMPELPEPTAEDHAQAQAAAPATARQQNENAPVSILDGEGELRTLEEIERDLIQFAIEVYSGHMSEVARRLGIGRSTLYRKVREHELEVEASRAG